MSIVKLRQDITIPLPGGVQYFIISKRKHDYTRFIGSIVIDSFDANYSYTLFQGFLTSHEDIPTIDPLTLDLTKLTQINNTDNEAIIKTELTGNNSFNGDNLVGSYLVLKLESATTTGTGTVYLETNITTTYDEE